MSQVVDKSKRLKLSHRAHTGRRLHRSHTSYPLLAVLLLMVGVFLALTTMQVRAVEVTVSASVHGLPPQEPAVILSPVQDDRFTDSSIVVSGTCQNGFYVKLYRNEIFSGAAACTSSDTFSITSDLFVGRNDLLVRIFNIADNEGPPSEMVTVYYDPPPAGGDGYQPSGQPDAKTPFYLSTEYFFKAAYTGQTIDWDFDIFGGKGPFASYVSWGDGYSDTSQNITVNNFTIEHSYKSLKDQREYFSVTVRVRDAEGYRASLQLIAIMNDPDVMKGLLSGKGPSNPSAFFSGVLKFVWSAYGLILLMGICFWLGERRGEAVQESFNRKRQKPA